MIQRSHCEWAGLASFLFTLIIVPPMSHSAALIHTFAGGGPNDLPASQVPVGQPSGVAVDAEGNRYFASFTLHKVFKIDLGGTIFTIAGGVTRGFCGDGGPATDACLDSPLGVAVDGSGNVFIADTGNQRIRKVSVVDGHITTIAGNGTRFFCGDGGPAVDACFFDPFGVAVDSVGNLFIADTNNHRIRKVDVLGGTFTNITTVAGNGTFGSSGDNGQATMAQLRSPLGVAVDMDGNILIADTDNNRIRKVNTAGVITTVAGNTIPGYCGDAGLATEGCLSHPSGVTVDNTGNLLIADQGNHRIRKVTVQGNIITTVAGNGQSGFCGDDTAATTACLANPFAVAVDQNGILFIADQNNKRIRKVENGIITSVTGTGSVSFCGDTFPATSACLALPSGIAVDGSGNLYFSDRNNLRIRKVDGNGIMTTVAGNGLPGFCADGTLATNACLTNPFGVAVDQVGNLFVADEVNQRIFRVDGDGIMTTVAGNGLPGFCADGTLATNACLTNPFGVAIDQVGNLFIADRGNHRILKMMGDGTVTTVAGNGQPGSCVDGDVATNACLNDPTGVVVDHVGNLFIADRGDHRIHKVDKSGLITTVAGNGQPGSCVDGSPATNACLNGPTGVAVDSDDNLFIADQSNAVIRKVDSSGTISTVAGNGLFGFSGDGGPATNASLANPFDIAVDQVGNLFIADQSNMRIRKVSVEDTLPPTVSAPAPIIVEALDERGRSLSDPTIQDFLAGATANDSIDGAITPTHDSPLNFPVGVTTTVTFTATDNAGNIGSASSTVTVRDTMAPTLSVPDNFSIGATGPSGAVVNYIVTATDSVTPLPTINCNPASETTFPIGNHEVTCTAQDSSGNVGLASFQVTVVDPTPLVLVVPEVGSLIFEATSASGAIAKFTVRVEGQFDPAPTVNCTPESSSEFALGTTTVDCMATDQYGHTGHASFEVMVRDTTPPSLTTVDDVPVEATSAAGAAVGYTVPTATDTVDAVPAVICEPASGSTFGIGATTVTCTATDASGNSHAASFIVTVADTTAPSLTMSNNVTAEASSAAGARVNYVAPNATDAVDPTPTVSCTPVNGSTFAIGETTVNCTAIDIQGNVGQASFGVVVQDTTPPLLSVPGDFAVVANSFTGTSVTYTTSAVDSVDGMLPTLCVPASGNNFSLGFSRVTCKATDTRENSAMATFQVHVAFPADTDGDSITDPVDPDVTLPSQNFTDAGLGGTTGGSITDRGDQSLVIMEAPTPNGLYILADPTGGPTSATLRLDEPCVDSSGSITGITVGIAAGSESIITCDSFVLDVLRGFVEVSFDLNSDSALVSLTDGAGLRLDPLTGAVTVPASSRAVVILLNDLRIEVGPGETIIPPVAVISPLSPIDSTTSIQLNGSDFSTVRLDGSDSSDADGATSELRFKWTVDQQMVCEGLSIECMTIEIPLESGNHVVALRVTDLSGLSDESSKAVTVDPTRLAVLEITKASIDFKHNPPRVNVRGNIDLPFGINYHELAPRASVKINLSGTSIVNHMAALRAFRSHWKFRANTRAPGLTKLDIDWNGARYKFKERWFPVELQSHLMSTTKTILSIKIKTGEIDDPFTLDIDGQAVIALDDKGNVTKCTIGGNGCTAIDLEVEKRRKELVLTLPFPLEENSIITFSGGLNHVMVVGDHLKPSVGSFELEATLDPTLLPAWLKTLPRELNLEVAVGSEGYTGTDSVDSTMLRITRHFWKTKGEGHHHHERDREKDNHHDVKDRNDDKANRHERHR